MLLVVSKEQNQRHQIRVSNHIVYNVHVNYAMKFYLEKENNDVVVEELLPEEAAVKGKNLN